MTPQDIITIVSTVGFPILACGAMAWYVKYTNDQHSKQLDEIMVQHKDEMAKVTEAVNNNTLALTKLCERMEHDADGD